MWLNDRPLAQIISLVAGNNDNLINLHASKLSRIFWAFTAIKERNYKKDKNKGKKIKSYVIFKRFGSGNWFWIIMIVLFRKM